MLMLAVKANQLLMGESDRARPLTVCRRLLEHTILPHIVVIRWFQEGRYREVPYMILKFIVFVLGKILYHPWTRRLIVKITGMLSSVAALVLVETLQAFLDAVSYTHLTLPTKRIV